MTNVVGDERVESLQDERDFLLRSLRDLEAERAAGDIDESDYLTLKDDYTARAAAVIRALQAKPVVRSGDGGSAPRSAAVAPVAPPRFSWKAPVTILVVLALAGLAGWAVASSAGERTAGQSATGSVPQSGNPIDAKLQTARDLIGQKKIVDAIKTYDDVLRDDPNQPEALAYRGWLLYLAGLGDQGLDSVTKATQADDSYPDAHFFRGQMLCDLRHDSAGAVTELRGYLSRVNPQDQSMVPMVEARLKSAMNGECANGATAGSTAGPTTSTP